MRIILITKIRIISPKHGINMDYLTATSTFEVSCHIDCHLYTNFYEDKKCVNY